MKELGTRSTFCFCSDSFIGNWATGLFINVDPKESLHEMWQEQAHLLDYRVIFFSRGYWLTLQKHMRSGESQKKYSAKVGVELPGQQNMQLQQSNGRKRTFG